MDSDWDSSEEETELLTSSLHIPINSEALHEYEAWVEKDCESLWWWKKEQRKKLSLEIPFELNDRQLQELK